MSLQVTCTCGKSFAAQPQLAGKTVACPACGGSLTIPGPAPASNSIRVSCACGKSFNAKPELAGRKVKCPACGSTIAVPSAALQAITSDDPLGLGSLDSAANDPLGLGNFDERAFAAPAAKMASKPAPGRPAATKSSAGGNQALIIGLCIGGGVATVALMVAFVFIFVLPALHAMKKENQEALNQRGIVPADNLANKGMQPVNSLGQPLRPEATPGYVPPGGGPPGGGPPTIGTAAPIPKEWITYNSAKDGYTVLLPSQPQERNESQQGSTMSVALVDLGSSRYSVYVRRPPADVATSPFFSIVESMDLTINRDIESAQGQVLSRKKVLFDGHPGLEVNYTVNLNGQQRKRYSRHYAIDKTIYSLIIESFDDPGSAQEKFFDSFKITDENAAGVVSNAASGSTPPSGFGGPGGPGPGGPGAGGPPGSSPPPNIGSPGGPSPPGGPSFRRGGPPR